MGKLSDKLLPRACRQLMRVRHATAGRKSLSGRPFVVGSAIPKSLFL
jgi:hypothetical protein